MDARRQLAQLVDRQARVDERLVERRQGGVRVALPLPARDLEAEQERDEPLLRPVVEVTRQAAALGVAGLDDAGARGPQRLDLRAQLDLEPPVLERERGGCRGVAQQLRALAQAAVVDQRPRGDVRGHARLARPGQHQRPASEIDVPSALGHAVRDRQRRVAERVAERVLRRPGVSREPVDQARDRGGAEEAAPHQARKERERQQGERGQEEHLRDPAPHVELLRGVGDRAERHDQRAEPEHRLEAAPLHRARRAPALGDEHERTRDHHELGQRLGGREGGGDVGFARDPQQVARAGTAGAVVVEPEQQRRQLEQRRDEVAGADHEPLGHGLEAARREGQQEMHEDRQDERVGQHAHQPRQRRVRELQPGRQGDQADRDHQHAGAAIRPPQRHVGADGDEPPGERDAQVADAAAAGRQPLGVARE